VAVVSTKKVSKDLVSYRMVNSMPVSIEKKTLKGFFCLGTNPRSFNLSLISSRSSTESHRLPISFLSLQKLNHFILVRLKRRRRDIWTVYQMLSQPWSIVCRKVWASCIVLKSVFLGLKKVYSIKIYTGVFYTGMPFAFCIHFALLAKAILLKMSQFKAKAQYMFCSFLFLVYPSQLWPFSTSTFLCPINRETDVRTDGQTDGWLGRRTDQQMDESADGTDEQTEW